MSVPVPSSNPVERATVTFDGSNWIAHALDGLGVIQRSSRPCSSMGAAVAELSAMTGKTVIVPLELAP